MIKYKVTHNTITVFDKVVGIEGTEEELVKQAKSTYNTYRKLDKKVNTSLVAIKYNNDGTLSTSI